MIQISRTTKVAASPGEVWRFFEEMDDNYISWHREHLRWRWLAGPPMEPGSTWFADEYFGWMRLSGRFFVTRSERERLFAFRLGLPSSLARAGGSFTLVPSAGGGTQITEEFHFGFRARVVGPVVDAVLRIALPLAAFRRHIAEEGEGLVRLLGAPRA